MRIWPCCMVHAQPLLSSSHCGRAGGSRVMVMVPRLFTSSRRVLLCVLVIGLSLAGCATSTVTGTQASTPIPSPTPSPTAVPACVTLVPSATPVTAVNNVPGIQLPAGTYSTPATNSGGGSGQYTIVTYTLCYAGT